MDGPSHTYITEDCASISELSEERILRGGERVVVRLGFRLLMFPLVLDLKTETGRSLCVHVARLLTHDVIMLVQCVFIVS